jgi:hypothetical protein
VEARPSPVNDLAWRVVDAHQFVAGNGFIAFALFFLPVEKKASESFGCIYLFIELNLNILESQTGNIRRDGMVL